MKKKDLKEMKKKVDQRRKKKLSKKQSKIYLAYCEKQII